MTTENDILVALSEGRERVLAEGEAKGRAEEKKAIANSLQASGVPIATIVKVTGLSVEMFS